MNSELQLLLKEIDDLQQQITRKIALTTELVRTSAKKHQQAVPINATDCHYLMYIVSNEIFDDHISIGPSRIGDAKRVLYSFTVRNELDCAYIRSAYSDRKTGLLWFKFTKKEISAIIGHCKMFNSFVLPASLEECTNKNPRNVAIDWINYYLQQPTECNSEYFARYNDMSQIANVKTISKEEFCDIIFARSASCC